MPPVARRAQAARRAFVFAIRRLYYPLVGPVELPLLLIRRGLGGQQRRLEDLVAQYERRDGTSSSAGSPEKLAR